jgi:uncharacterized protein (TIGR00725 family)
MSYIAKEQKDWIAVLGAARNYNEEQIVSAYKIGFELARRGKNLITGGTTGIPYAAAVGAKQGGAMVIGISPAEGLDDHILRYKKPVDHTDFLVFTGMGAAARSSILMRSVKGAVFIGGEFGTLNEFSAGWMVGNNILAVLQESGGISDYINEIISSIRTDWGSKVIFESDPILLVDTICEQVDLVTAEDNRILLEEIGNDVRNAISRYLGNREKASCEPRPVNTLIGALSNTSQL